MWRQIHEENVAKLSDMSPQEILEAREQLLSTTDPAIVRYLRSRRKKQDPVGGAFRDAAVSEQNEAAQGVDLREMAAPLELVSHPQAQKWLHFDSVEPAKLLWMKDLEVAKIKKEESYEAR